MTSISHVLIGAAIAAKLGNPALIAPAALAVHFICDVIPHWDWGTNYRKRPKKVTGTLAIGETLIALFIGFFFFSSVVPLPALTTGIIFSLLPDWLEAPYHIMAPNAPKIFYYLYKPQSIFHSRAQLPWGIITQIATVGLFLYWGFVIK